MSLAWRVEAAVELSAVLMPGSVPVAGETYAYRPQSWLKTARKKRDVDAARS